MHIHILGICGTFMGSLALIAREMGYTVSGSDSNVYPPMSTQLEREGIALQEGFDPSHMQDPEPDLVVIGNAMARGNTAVEYVLNKGLDYCSGPEWLARHVLPHRWVLAVAGTHGKTTTSAMLAWILDYAGMAPGYLIGGVLQNFPVSARLGETPFFVVEADEYDSAFFDKRSKFIHYRPRTVILNNLEFDHADIFPDLAAIQRQFHHLVRTIPSEGLIIAPRDELNVQAVLNQGCWSALQTFGVGGMSNSLALSANVTPGSHWQAELDSADGSQFTLSEYKHGGERLSQYPVTWSLAGEHNVSNALAAVVAARHVGVDPGLAAEALADFTGVKRRMELLGTVGGVEVYDDFAHHPTAIASTLEAMRARLPVDGQGRLIAVIEPRSNTMRMGVHQQELISACAVADLSIWLQPESTELSLDDLVHEAQAPALVFRSTAEIIRYLVAQAQSGDVIVVMSNGGFEGIHQRLLDGLQVRE